MSSSAWQMLSLPQGHSGSGRGSVPLYYQIKEHLRAQIEQGELRPGERIPSIRELAAEHGVSVITTRQAIQALAHEGLVEIRERSGAFVKPTVISLENRVVTRFRSALLLTEELRRRGFQPSMRVLHLAVEPAPLWLRRLLALPAGAAVCTLRRLKYIHRDEPLLAETAYLPEARVPGIADRDLTGSLTRLLEQAYGIVLERNQEWFRPVFLDEVEGEWLARPAGELALCVDRISTDDSDHPVVFVRSLIRADRASVYVELTRGRLDMGRFPLEHDAYGLAKTPPR